MRPEEVEAIFDQMAATYDQQWARLAPVRDGLNLLLTAVLSGFGPEARVLCVGAGTGAEVLHLARQFPTWHFTVVEPSASMVEVCRRRTEQEGIAGRCAFHHGYLDSLPGSEEFDAATSILVSQFILEQDARSQFFRAIAARLRPGGYLVCADLAADIGSAAYRSLLEVWLRMMNTAQVPAEMRERLRAAYERDVAVLPPERVATIIEAGGFEKPIPFFQAGLIHAWYTRPSALRVA